MVPRGIQSPGITGGDGRGRMGWGSSFSSSHRLSLGCLSLPLRPKSPFTQISFINKHWKSAKKMKNWNPEPGLSSVFPLSLSHKALGAQAEPRAEPSSARRGFRGGFVLDRGSEVTSPDATPIPGGAASTFSLLCAHPTPPCRERFPLPGSGTRQTAPHTGLIQKSP